MKEIPLTGGKVAVVDDCDFEWASSFKWCSTKCGDKLWYAVRKDEKGSKKVYMHREIAARAELPFSPKYDHKDRNGLNNQRFNIRPCTSAQNSANSRKLKAASSRFKGVIWYARLKKWVAMIRVNGKSKFLGYFSDEVKALEAYSEAASHYFGKFAHHEN